MQAKPAPEPPLKRITLPRPHFVEKTARDRRGRRRKYVVYVPPAYRPNRLSPAILYLHGMGERGRDGRKPCSIGIAPAIVEYGKAFPFIVIFPQAIEFDRTDDEFAMTILDATCSEYRIDPDRIYLSGLSMGGIGTWRIGTRHPDRFAALAPVCGEADPKLAANLRRTPVWCFHGDADPVVLVGESRRMIAAMRELGLTPKYSEYASVTHNSWDRAYGERGLYTWLLRHRRVRRPRRIQYHFPSREFETPHTLWWLRLDAVRKRPSYGFVDAAMAGAGVLKIRTRGVKQVSVPLDDGPFGRATSWQVELNGRRCRVAAEERCLVLRPTAFSEEDQR